MPNLKNLIHNFSLIQLHSKNHIYNLKLFIYRIKLIYKNKIKIRNIKYNYFYVKNEINT